MFIFHCYNFPTEYIQRRKVHLIILVNKNVEGRAGLKDPRIKKSTNDISKTTKLRIFQQ